MSKLVSSRGYAFWRSRQCPTNLGGHILIPANFYVVCGGLTDTWRRRQKRKETPKMWPSYVCAQTTHVAPPPSKLSCGGAPDVNHIEFYKSHLRVSAPCRVGICFFPVFSVVAYNITG